MVVNIMMGVIFDGTMCFGSVLYPLHLDLYGPTVSLLFILVFIVSGNECAGHVATHHSGCSVVAGQEDG
jgi:hypothetical protein